MDSNTHTNTQTLKNDNDLQTTFVGESQIEVSDIVAFDDAGQVDKFTAEEHNFLSEYANALPDSTNKSLAEILSRYDFVQQGQFDSNILTYDLKTMITQMHSFNKLDGFMGFTGTFSIKIVWNVDPMVQGVYMLAYKPPGYEFPPLPDLSAYQQNLFYQTFYSGCQRQLFSLSESTSVELEIPYVGPDTFIPLGQGLYELLGSIVVVPLSVINGTSLPSAVNFRLYLSIKNLQTYGAVPRAAKLTYHTQGGVSEAEAKRGPVAKATSSIHQFLESAGKYVPSSIVPSKFIDAASWTFGGVSKIADLLGWAKPFSVTENQSFTKLGYRDITTSDSTFVGAKMAMNSDAGLAHVDLSGRSVDEMQISEALSRPNLAIRQEDVGGSLSYPFTWKASNVPGDILWTYAISPSTSNVAVHPEDPWFIMNHLSYVSSLFLKWRGSLCFTFQPGSTNFHSGRLRLAFWPYIDSSAYEPNNYSYSYNHIIDVRDPTSWSATVPFISSTPWKEYDEYTGFLTVFVESQLIHSSSTLDHIDIVPLISAGETFELAIPSLKHALRPVVGSPVTYHTQAGLADYHQERRLPLSMAPDMASSSVTNHSLAIGDPVRSLRAVCKKFWVSSQPVWRNTGQTTSFVQLPHPMIPIPKDTATAVDMISNIAHIYNYWRGGVRIFAQNYYPSRVYAVPMNGFVAPDTMSNGQARENVDYGTVSSFAAVGTDEPTKIELPYSFSTICMNNYIPFISPPYERLFPDFLALILDYFIGDAGIVVAKAMSDDFDMGTLIGAPICRRVNA